MIRAKEVIHNAAARRALLALSHPITIGMVALLIVNDHVLRRLWPSWLTGKLGDAAWLAFAPLLIALPLAWILPRRPQHERLVGGLAFGLMGGGFALAKTLPLAYGLAAALMTAITGAASGLRRDPTDLLALPALLIGWAIWQRGSSQRRQTARGWVALALGALATLANSPAPDFGIDCLLIQEDGSLIALSSSTWRQERYRSTDGGLTWDTTLGADQSAEPCEAHSEPWQLADPGNPQQVYRFTPGKRVELSTDGGQSWTTSVRFSGVEARTIYYRLTRSAAWAYHPGPLDAVFDPATGNLVAVMGQEGALVLAPGGEWQPVAVGPYVIERIQTPGQMWTLLRGEGALALALLLLGFATLCLLVYRPRWWLIALVGLGWVVWLACAISSPGLNVATYLSMPIGIGTALAVLIAAVCAVAGGVWAARASGRFFAPAAVAALIAALLYMIPFVLWAAGAVPRYATALIFALVLAAAVLISGWRAFHSRASRGKEGVPPGQI
jgi:hypothetical protein